MPGSREHHHLVWILRHDEFEIEQWFLYDKNVGACTMMSEANPKP